MRKPAVMHDIKVSMRLIALLAVAIAAVLAFASLSPSQPRQVEAGAQPVIQAGITCNDVWLDFPPTSALGQPHGPEDALVAKSMTRIEPSQTGGPKDFDLTTITYLGPDLKENDESFPGDLVPDKPPTLLPCQDKRTNGLNDPEANQMNPNTPFAMVSNHRPTNIGTLVADGPDWNLVSITCAFSEEEKQWVRTESVTRIINVGPGAKNLGLVVLNLGTAPPVTGVDVDGDTKIDVAVDAADAATCVDIPGTIPFPSILESVSRAPTTDHPEQAKNAGIAIDPDGSVADACAAHSLVNQKEKDEAECQDADTLADDWDGDGCPDWDELDKDFINGRDPFNPNDCNIDDFTGSFSALATVQAATDGTPGSYFHAIIAINHNTGDNSLSGALQVYLDSSALDAGGPPSVTPSGIDGNPGAPPPPPYTTSAPNVVNGTFDKINQLLIFDFCVADIGGLFAPNAIAHAEVDAHTLKGTVLISGNQTQAACASKTRNTNLPQIQLPPVDLVLVRQGVNANHDKDKCTDMEELLGTGPATCGDDPYNPHDSDENFNSIGNLIVTVYTPPGFGSGGTGGADWDKTLGEIIPGAYYHCITDTQHDLSANDLQVKAFCYIDSTTVGLGQINPEAYPGVLGDGIEGDGPPFPSTALLPGGVWADVADNQTKLTGTYDPVDGHLHIEGCFADKDGFGSQGNVYAATTVDAATGQGSAELTILISSQADCENGPPFADGVPFPTTRIEIVEQANKGGQGAGYDTDRDGCSDKEELGDDQVFGGLRDPYKYWDLYDPDQNRQVALGDFLAVLARFGSAGDRFADPLTIPPAAPAYHTRFDRGGQQAGTAGLGWNELPPNGQIALGDFLSLLRQFGHSCRTGPNDPAYPYQEEEEVNVNLTIHNGQSGPPIAEDKEEIPGAFTVANLNDTDADGVVDKDDGTVEPDLNGRNEVDLVKVIIDKPDPDSGGNVTLTLTGDGTDTKLWKMPTKVNEETRRAIPTADLPLTLWLEGRVKSTALRDITIQVDYLGASDKGQVTFVWAELTQFLNSDVAIPADLDLKSLINSINEDEAADGSLFGHGPFKDNGTGVDTKFGGRMLMEFTVSPSGIGGEPGVRFDITRQIEVRAPDVIAGVVVPDPNVAENFPQGQGKDEKPNDDKSTVLDEDNTPKNNHIYSYDFPSDTIQAGGRDFAIGRMSFREFVRVRFDDTAFTHNSTEPLEGSRASNRDPWHSIRYLKRGTDGKWQADNNNPSAAAPRRTGTGNGTMTVPVTGAAAVTERWTVTFNAGGNNWSVEGTVSGMKAVATTGNAYAPANGRISFTITAGGTAFVDIDKFTFSTFRSSAGKQNETAQGAIDATAAP